MLLFVYGTLKSGGRNVHLMKASKFIREATTEPHYRIYDFGAHPALVRDDADGLAISGELWDVTDPETLAELDAFEEVPDWFHRAAIAVVGESQEVHSYFYSRPIPPNTPSANLWPRV
jgi:gamma-glutamylaminecyclotransferase